MSLEDPYLIVHNEVVDGLAKLRNDFIAWERYQEESTEISKEDYETFVIDLKNGLKSIQWDMDELEDSLLTNEKEAKLDLREIEKRRKFITDTRQEVMGMSEKLQKSSSKTKSKTDFSINFGSQNLVNKKGYTRLSNDADVSSPKEMQLKLNYEDDEHKSPYISDHSTILDEVDHAVNVIDSNHSRVDRLKELLYLTTIRRQIWAGVATLAMFLLIIIFLL